MEKEKKRAQFSELNDEDKRIVSKRCYDAVLVCSFRGNTIKEKYKFASPQFILDKAEYYVQNFANTSEKLLYMKKKQEYEQLSQSNGIYYREDTKYQQYIMAISNITDMEELDKYIKGNNPSGKEIPIHSLNLAISDRARALGDKNGIYSSVKEKLLSYGKYKYDKRAKENKNKSMLTLEENKLLSKITLQAFLDSEFIYKQDFCKNQQLSVNTFDKRVANVKEFDFDFYQVYLSKAEEKKQKYYDSLKPVVENILNNLKNNKNYNIIDYYLAYQDLYTFEDLCQCCNKFKLDIRALKTFLGKADVRSTLSYDSFLEEKYIAFSHEFSKSEKEQIYKYAKDNFIPINWQNISLLVSKHYKNNQYNLTEKARPLN